MIKGLKYELKSYQNRVGMEYPPPPFHRNDVPTVDNADDTKTKMKEDPKL
jgi:hypothetical protein